MIAVVFILFFGLVAAWLVAPKPDLAGTPIRSEPTPEPTRAKLAFPSS